MPTVRLKTEAADRSGETPVMRKPGDLLECDEATARYIVEQGRGEYVETPKPERPETAAVEAPESAVRPRPTRRRPTTKREE